jgi:hypothetical protein
VRVESVGVPAPVVSEMSSRTKLVSRLESSVPVKVRVNVCPTNALTLTDRCR